MRDQLPNLAQLYESVEEASKTWQDDRDGTKTGRAKKAFANLCNTFRDHSSLLSIIPQNDKYVTLLTGSLSAIAQASMNHADIASGIADSMDQLAQDMAYWNEMLKEYGHTAVMQRCIVDLYVVIFEFFTDIFCQWSKSGWQRFRTSFNDRAFAKLFEEKRSRMRAIEHRMRRDVDLENHRTWKRAALNMQTDFQTIKNKLDHNANMQETIMFQQSMFVKLGANVQLLLDHHNSPAQIESALGTGSFQLPWPEADLSSNKDFRPAANQGLLTARPPDALQPNDSERSTDLTIPPGDSGPVPSHLRRDKVLAIVQPIVEEYSRQVQTTVDIMVRASTLAIEVSIMNKLTNWMRSEESESLWIRGPYGVSNPSQNALTAVSLTALASENKVPCISYCCSLAASTTEDAAETTPQGLMMKTLESLIVQLVMLFPATTTILSSITEQHFQDLVSGSADVAQVLKLFHDLLSGAPTLLFIIVEGLQVLEEREDGLHTTHFLRFLEELTCKPDVMHAPDTGEDDSLQADLDPTNSIQRVIKVCFFTDGHVDSVAALAENDRIEKVVYDADASQTSTGEDQKLMSHWSEEMKDRE